MQTKVAQVGELLIRAAAVIGTLSKEEQAVLSEKTDGKLIDCLAWAIEGAAKVSQDIVQSMSTHPPIGFQALISMPTMSLPVGSSEVTSIALRKMDIALTKEESDQWDRLCSRLDIADDFRSTEVSFVLNYLRSNGQLQGLFDFADETACVKEAEVARENESQLWETWCLSVCKDHGVPLDTQLASEAALVIERLAPTGQWNALDAGPIGSSMHKEWIASRLPKRLSDVNKTEQASA